MLCPEVITGIQGLAQKKAFNDALVITDPDFTSREDCNALAGFFQSGESLKGVSGSAFDYSGLDSLADSVWHPEPESAINQLFQSALSWLQSLGLDISSDKFDGLFQQYLLSLDLIQLFLSVFSWFILLVAVYYVSRYFYRQHLLRAKQNRRETSNVNHLKSCDSLTTDAIGKLPCHEQAGALLQHTIRFLQSRDAIPLSGCYINHELLHFLGKENSPVASLFD